MVHRLGKLGLLREAEVNNPASAARLVALCDDGLLFGGLTVAPDVRPDELLGPLLQLMNGSARMLRVVDVRDEGGVVLSVQWGEVQESWSVSDTRDLVRHLNEKFAGEPGVRPILVLGEWNDSLQLWCLPRAALRALRAEPWLTLENGEVWTQTGLASPG
jgi:hypothetical protein